MSNRGNNMKSYTVTFTQYHTYEVEAKDEDEAEDKAYKEFQSDMRRSAGSAFYDDVEVECNEDDEDGLNRKTLYL